MSEEDNRQAAGRTTAPDGENEVDEIVVTPEMVEAGLLELHDHNYGDDMREILEDVFRAMAYATKPRERMRQGPYIQRGPGWLLDPE